MSSLGNHTGKKSIDLTTAAGVLDGTNVRQEAHAADRLKLKRVMLSCCCIGSLRECRQVISRVSIQRKDFVDYLGRRLFLG